MSKVSFISVVVDTDAIIGVLATQEEGYVIVKDAFRRERTASLKDDMVYISQRHGWDGEPLGIVKQGQSVVHNECVPDMELNEVMALANWKLDDFVPWEKGTYHHDFVLRNVDKDPMSDEVKKLLSIVALKKDDIWGMTEAVVATEGYLTIVDYWPGPLCQLNRTYLEEENVSRVNVIFGKEGASLYAWYGNVLVGERHSVRTIDDWEEAMIALDAAMTALYVEPISGVNWGMTEDLSDMVGEQTQQGIQNVVAYDALGGWDFAINHWGKAPSPMFHYYGENTSLVKERSLPWQIALGLATRGVKKYCV